MINYAQKKGRSNKGNFFALPKEIMNSEAFQTLPPQSMKILLHMCSQYFGSNNGDLRATEKTMQGWGMSGGALAKWRDKLEESGLIVRTRKGRPPNLASLYGLTWLVIDVNGREEHQYQGNVKTPLGYWKNKRNPEYIQRHKKKYQPPALKVIKDKKIESRFVASRMAA